jgi:hypothetical protein
MSKLTGAALDRAAANALGLKSVNNCEKWSQAMTEEDDDTQVYKKPWVGLTDEEVNQFHNWKDCTWSTNELVRYVESKLREKNA